MCVDDKLQPLPRLDNLVVGLGATGLSVARHLAARGENFAVVDSRAQPPGLAALQRELQPDEVYFGSFDRRLFLRAKRLIVSPGVSLSSPAIAEARAAGAEVIGDVELFARLNRAPVVAITGSNGKSTVTTLLGAMAQTAQWNVAVGGNLGTPALDLLSEQPQDLVVLELSSFQLEAIESLAPRAAVVLNLSPDHMDRYASFEAYAQAKGRIYAKAEHCVVNREDRPAAALSGHRDCVSFGLDEPQREHDYGLRQHAGAQWFVRGSRPLLPVAGLRIAGRHNLANALAALALGEAAGLPLAAMLDAVRNFPGLPHRCQWIGTRDGVDWFDDSKGTNVGATVAAVAGLEGTLVLLAGGQGKGQDFTPLRDTLAGRARAVVLLGEAAPELRKVLAGVTELIDAADMESAVSAAQAAAQPGDRVLLSPACASLDMFTNYVARGEAFVKAFRSLRS
ncbi:UDP-N-acetylmuramoyl-L-alanine--D-glutamate ligase [Acidihalobacter ferrooxydans]|uniref:UDP-N-acetylmuramoylalanine--D-glutamate ligase n=2 Tax=Acidihalobacter ferrooxydans TaxID=1765967 RepID=A0A1P8UKY2_9GAMM|nr:UDP-N-acetylmuramoyl-L-alanine--D-glutamate ligase [Acidihalobacter ferrooxydans]